MHWICWILFVPLVAAMLLLEARFVRRTRPGWRRAVTGVAGAVLLVPVTFLVWGALVSGLTWGIYTCLRCGRTEGHEDYFGVRVSTELDHTGEDYVRRFAPQLPADHAHDWHLESCLFRESLWTWSVSCSIQVVEGWFRVLPRLADRAAADELYREAESLPHEQRCKLMANLGSSLWNREGEEELDDAFRVWREQRPSPLEGK